MRCAVMRALMDEATAPGPSFRASAGRARRPADRETRKLASRRGRGKASRSVVTVAPALHTLLAHDLFRKPVPTFRGSCAAREEKPWPRRAGARANTITL